MLNNVRDAVIARLTAAGLSAGAAWPHGAVPAEEGIVRVGVLRAENRSGGFGRYLGLHSDPVRGETEVYGLRCEMTLSLDIYVPLSEADAAGDCLAIFDTAMDCLGSGETGMQLRALRCGAPEPDRDSRMMHLRGEADGSALLVLEGSAGETAAFQDFVLRGELET